MELKSLVLGLLFSVGIFGVKSGVGLHYFYSRNRNLLQVVLVFLLFGMLYGGVFTTAGVLLPLIDLPTHFQKIQQIMQHGMLVHLVMAIFMTVWGLGLLKQATVQKRKRHLSWLALTIPCPVCMTVVVFSVAFLISVFPENIAWAVGGLFSGFMLLNILAVWGMRRFAQASRHSSESLLGAAMLAMAAYFMLSVSVMPHVAELDNIYRLAAYSVRDESGASCASQTWMWLFIPLFLFGYLRFKLYLRKGKKWNSVRS